MQHTHYLIVGASHAALSALHAIRLHDPEQAVTLLTRDDSLPYSPTVLPYVVSGRSAPGRAGLRFPVRPPPADAPALREALPRVKRAVVLGGGLIGMHAAENLAKGGVEVSVGELQPHVLSGYFDAEASAMIEKVFAANGVRLLT